MRWKIRQDFFSQKKKGQFFPAKTTLVLTTVLSFLPLYSVCMCIYTSLWRVGESLDSSLAEFWFWRHELPWVKEKEQKDWFSGNEKKWRNRKKVFLLTCSFASILRIHVRYPSSKFENWFLHFWLYINFDLTQSFNTKYLGYSKLKKSFIFSKIANFNLFCD